MAFQAVGWLSNKFGVNIAGRNEGSSEEGAQGDAPTATGQQQQQQQNQVEGMFSSWSNTVFGGSGGNDGAQAGPKMCTGGKGDDQVQLDEQGLPITRSWYYYDKDLGRMNVADDAPQHIKDEFAAQLQEEEDKKNGVKKFPDPPPPPPPTGSASASPLTRAPGTPMYANAGFFGDTTGSTAQTSAAAAPAPQQPTVQATIAPAPAPPAPAAPAFPAPPTLPTAPAPPASTSVQKSTALPPPPTSFQPAPMPPPPPAFNPVAAKKSD